MSIYLAKTTGTTINASAIMNNKEPSKSLFYPIKHNDQGYPISGKSINIINLPDNCFNNDYFKNLKNLYLNEGLETLGIDCFGYPSIIFDNIILPSTIKRIHSHIKSSNIYENGVDYCNNLACNKDNITENITIKDNIKYIGCKFSYNKNLKSINFSNSVDYIGSFAFSNSQISTIDLNKISHIDNNCFSDCANLTKVTCSNLNIIEDHIFDNCNLLNNLDFSNKLDDNIPKITIDSFNDGLNYNFIVPLRLLEIWCESDIWNNYINRIKPDSTDPYIYNIKDINILTSETSHHVDLRYYNLDNPTVSVNPDTDQMIIINNISNDKDNKIVSFDITPKDITGLCNINISLISGNRKANRSLKININK